MRRSRAHRRERSFAAQATRSVRCGNYILECPGSHILLQTGDTQPLRDQAVAFAAQYLGEKYPDSTMIDIGANIGDTAALMASSCRNRLLLVEPSDYYFGLLQRNSTCWPNPTVLKKVLVGAESAAQLGVFHWGGTAEFVQGEIADAKVPTERLCNLTSEHVCFVKTDTDGYDFQLLLDGLPWLKQQRPGVLLEVAIRSISDSAVADELFTQLHEIGYAHFVVWDDAGWPIIAGATIDGVRQLNRYLQLIWTIPHTARIFNYDVLCLQSADADVLAHIERRCAAPIASGPPSRTVPDSTH
jgi:FkbM family methyltransferase